MQNKPNLLDTQINVTSVLTKDYENLRPCRLRENKPNSNPILSAIALAKAEQSQSNPILSAIALAKAEQSQYKPNSRNVQIDVNLVKTRNYNNEQRTMNYYANLSAIALAKAEQTQSNPISEKPPAED